MRNILFRGRRSDGGGWVTSGSVIRFDENDEVFIPEANGKCMTKHDEQTGDILAMWDTRFHKVDPETIGEYTGMTDQDGQEIFEGDILEGRYDEERPEDTTNAAVFRGESGWRMRFAGGETDSIDQFACEHNRVVGNIHDNPELLEGGA